METFLFLMIGITTFDYGLNYEIPYLPNKLRKCLSCWVFWTSVICAIPMVIFAGTSIYTPFAAWLVAYLIQENEYDI